MCNPLSRKGEIKMIEVKIYCTKKHELYQSTYDTVTKIMTENNLEYRIERITDTDVIRRRNITNQPLIVINNQIIMLAHPPSEHDIKVTLIRMKLL
ncbi:MAG: thioredoxin family protein [Alphaproteobacteria bacterium]|nr:thioredoxin family protein [Alphaproteobacteria bacterium]